MQERLERLSEHAAQMEREMLRRIDEVHRSYKRELVPWQPPGAALGTRLGWQGRTGVKSREGTAGAQMQRERSNVGGGPRSSPTHRTASSASRG